MTYIFGSHYTAGKGSHCPGMLAPTEQGPWFSQLKGKGGKGKYNRGRLNCTERTREMNGKVRGRLRVKEKNCMCMKGRMHRLRDGQNREQRSDRTYFKNPKEHAKKLWKMFCWWGSLWENITGTSAGGEVRMNHYKSRISSHCSRSLMQFFFPLTAPWGQAAVFCLVLLLKPTQFYPWLQ